MAIENTIANFGRDAGAGLTSGLEKARRNRLVDLQMQEDRQQRQRENRLADMALGDQREQRSLENQRYDQEVQREQQAEQLEYMQSAVQALQSADPEARPQVWQGVLRGAEERGWDISDEPMEWQEGLLPKLQGQFGVSTDRGSQFGQVNPRDFTPESLAKYERTGNYEDLDRYTEFTQGGARYSTGDGGEVAPIVGDVQALSTADLQAEVNRRESRGSRIGKGEGAAAVSGIEADAAAEKARAESQARQSVALSGELFENTNSARSSLTAINDAISALDEGARSGPIINRLTPTISNSTIQLQNAGRRLGLDVISSVTFGALSEAEMNIAMQTAMPNLPPQELRKWLVDRRDAQENLARELEDAALFMSRGGTLDEFIERGRNGGQGRQSETARSQDGASGQGQQQTQPQQGGIRFLGFE